MDQVHRRVLRISGLSLVPVVSVLLAYALVVAVKVEDDAHRVGHGPPASAASSASPSRDAIAESDQPSMAPTAAAPETAEQTTAGAPSPDSASTGARLLLLLDAVAVVPERPQVDGYERDCGPGEGCVFGTAWNDDTTAPLGRNGCDTRNDVLRRDLVAITLDPDTGGCVVRTGILDDPYTGRRIEFERGYDTSAAVQIDHLIPLAAAWDLGAWRWSPAQRAAFANDVDHELLAVDGPTNLAKVDSTPASWLPPNKAFRCEYGVRYLEASLFWKLPVTAADVDVLRHVARRCP